MQTNDFVKDKKKHALIDLYRQNGYRPTEARIMAAIATAKNIGVQVMEYRPGQEILDEIAAHFKLKGMLVTNRISGNITGWTQTKRLTA